MLDRPGAVDAPVGSPDHGMPWHYGDPFAEQRAAARSVAVVDRSHREVLAVSGDDRLSWLHSLTSQDLASLADGASTEALVLDVHGRVEHHAVVTHHGDTVWLDVERGTGQALLAYLEAMRFWSKVEPRDATSELAVLSVVGPETARVIPEDVPGGFVRSMPWPGGQAADLLVPRAELPRWWDRVTSTGARPAGSWAFDALRVEALRPRLGVDTDDRTIPHEVNWIGHAVHLDKGCYRGQETVAKVHNVGRPPRRMPLLHLDGSLDVLPDTGDPVLLDGRPVGRVGTAVRHHELGPIALALVKRSVPVEAELVAGTGDRAVPARIDPDSVPPDTPGLGREAARNFGR
ncbi:MAG: folate-binding protein YgfZ [Kutzneria sp.]|nr:folate-binding protein YgfZ [Kutzneria sp.]MBV9847824.1 folate-binding protein YgfZ [Kutzneria sp.]